MATRRIWRLRLMARAVCKQLLYCGGANPGGGPFRYVPFGAVVEEDRRFGDYTIPSRLRVGWYIGTDRFEREGEFFRVTVDDAAYR